MSARLDAIRLARWIEVGWNINGGLFMLMTGRSDGIRGYAQAACPETGSPELYVDAYILKKLIVPDHESTC